MAKQSDLERIDSIEALEALYGTPAKNSLVKELDHISEHYRAFIEHSPFVIIGTCGPEGLDCSPRGDPAGFVRIVDANTLLLPDRRGNNRADSLRNLVRDPRISLLFLVPGVGETLRINGEAEILVDEALCASFAMNGKPARSVIRVHAQRVYFQCQKALKRSSLWDPEARVERSQLPTAGQIIQALAEEPFDGAEYDRAYPEHMRNTMY